MALKGVCQFQLHKFPWAARGWSYELTLVYKFWLSNHIVTVTLSQCGFGSEMAWDQAIPGAHFQEWWCLNLLRVLQQNTTDQASNKQQKCISYSCRGLQAQDRGASMFRFWSEPSSGLQTAGSSLCPHTVKGMRELSAASFITALIPFTRALLSSPTHLS